VRDVAALVERDDDLEQVAPRPRSSTVMAITECLNSDAAGEPVHRKRRERSASSGPHQRRNGPRWRRWRKIMKTQDRELQDDELNAAVLGGSPGYPGLPPGASINMSPFSYGPFDKLWELVGATGTLPSPR
jgi:hypothetical protein